MIIYIAAGLTGLLMARIINLDFNKTDVSPVWRTLSNVINSVIMAGLSLLFIYYYGLSYRFIVYIMLAVNLLYISNYDIREQAVSYECLLVSAVCGFAVLIYNRDSAWWDYLASGVGYTAVFLLVSRLTHNAIGKGDALITGVIGLFLGFFQTFAVIFFALLLGGIISIILFLMKKVSRQTPLPFAPFLAAGFLVSILI